jgi:alpha-mannosidase
MELIDKRINRTCMELKRLSRVQRISITNWMYKEGNYVHPEDVENDVSPWKEFDTNVMHWYGKDKHYWFRGEFTVPESFHGKALWIVVRTQIDEWDDGKNPQFLLFVNGEATQGLDMNHREVLLSGSVQGGTTYTLDLQSYTGIIHSEFKLLCDMVEVDPDILDLYYDIKMPISAFGRMNKDDKIRLDLQTVLNNTINMIDLRKPYSDEFYGSIKDASSYIKKALYEDMAGFDDIIATCIGHTHIDVAWWWTVEQTREKVGRSFATVLKFMDEYPNYKFMSSQPQLYYFLKERYPELYAKLKERVKEGRWEPEGGMWVEADCNLTSGESLVRQFIHGKKFFEEEFGVDNRILWLPDVFGYSGALPQIMKKCGIDYFMTTKLAWNQFNKMPYDTLKWRGIDGTEVLTHLITTLGVGQSTDQFFTTYNGMLHPDAIMGGWTRYQNKEINNDILIAFGYGDGGGGPTRDMLENSKRMEKGIKGIPKVRQEFSRTYFQELEERVIDNKRLPVWEGEFYFEYHRGTYTSMARNKRSNRKSEFMLMDLELLSVLAMKNGINYPTEDLDKMWKTVLLNQFHDILPGSSIKEVYEVTKKEYEEIEAIGNKLINQRLEGLTSKGSGITVYNTLGFNRNDVVVLGDVDGEALSDNQGTIYPIQQTNEGAVVYLTNLPSKGSKTFAFVEQKEQVVPFILNENRLETPYYNINLNEKGFFTSIYDKEFGREILKEGQFGNFMRVYEDKPLDYDNWDIEIYYTEKFFDVDTITRMEWTEIGSVRATLEIDRNYSNSIIKQKIYFYAGSRRIDFNTYVDWKENQHLLKVHFPVNIHTDEATFDIQFGNVTRKVHTNTSWDMARFESCGQKWVDVSEGHYGVSILNDCKYGHSIKDGNIGLTLIKSGILPNPTTDQEEHYFTYSLYPHGGNWRDGNTVQEAYKLNQPSYTAIGGNAGDIDSLVSVDKKNVMIETVKLAEDNSGIIIRLYEYENALTKVKVNFNNNFVSVKECDLLENEIESVQKDSNHFITTIKPYEIKTFKVVVQ